MQWLEAKRHCWLKKAMLLLRGISHLLYTCHSSRFLTQIWTESIGACRGSMLLWCVKYRFNFCVHRETDILPLFIGMVDQPDEHDSWARNQDDRGTSSFPTHWHTYWLSKRLQTMETFIQQSESKAGELQRAQDQQSEALSAQSRAQEAIQFDAQVSQALLAKTSVAAANLQSVIDDAAFKFKHVSGFGIGGSSAWSLCAVLLIVIAAQNLKIAISLFFLILGTCVLHGRDWLVLIQYGLGHSIALTILKFL